MMGIKEMIIFYSKPNTLTLPYVNEKTKLQSFFRFVPGKNHVPEKTWLAIVKAANKRMTHYDTILNVFQPKETVEVKGETEDGEEIISVDVGKDEKSIDYESLNAKDMNALVENTMELKELEHLQRMEKDRAKPRKSVLTSLGEKIAQINEIEELFKNAKK